jgi:hypothetical protein
MEEDQMDIDNLGDEFSSISLQGENIPKLTITILIPTHGNVIINSGKFEPPDPKKQEFKRNISIIKNNIVNIIRKNKLGVSCSSSPVRKYFKKMLPFVSFNNKDTMKVFLDTLNDMDYKQSKEVKELDKMAGVYKNENNYNTSYVYIPDVKNNQYANKLMLIDQINDPIEIVTLYINDEKHMDDIQYLNERLNEYLTVRPDRRFIDLNSLFIIINEIIKKYVNRQKIILEINVVDLSCNELPEEGHEFAALPISNFDIKSKQFPFVEQSKAPDVAYFGKTGTINQDVQSDFTVEEVKGATPGDPRIQAYTRRSREPRKSIFREQPITRDRSRSRDRTEKGGRKLKKKNKTKRSHYKTKKHKQRR